MTLRRRAPHPTPVKIVETPDVFAKGPFPASPEWARVGRDVERAIKATDWPHGSGTFTIYPERNANGVVPIKIPCVETLKAKCGWLKALAAASA